MRKEQYFPDLLSNQPHHLSSVMIYLKKHKDLDLLSSIEKKTY